ncbi:hypothetical protein ACWEOE_18385 [Amycolatopsis sp. NPDC004368]
MSDVGVEDRARLGVGRGRHPVHERNLADRPGAAERLAEPKSRNCMPEVDQEVAMLR